MFFKVFSVCFVLLVVVSQKRWCNGANGASYTFRYSVDHGLVLTQHWEERRADLVRGSYTLLDPDGKVRIVEYHVNGKAGFHAVVHYRKPPEPPPVGHLRYPYHYRRPVLLAKPVALITGDLFRVRRTYPNLPD